MKPEPADLETLDPEQARIAAKLKARFPEGYRAEQRFRGQLSVWLDRAALGDAPRFL